MVVLDFFWRFTGGGEWVRDLSLAIAAPEAEAIPRLAELQASSSTTSLVFSCHERGRRGFKLKNAADWTYHNSVIVYVYIWFYI